MLLVVRAWRSLLQDHILPRQEPWGKILWTLMFSSIAYMVCRSLHLEFCPSPLRLHGIDSLYLSRHRAWPRFGWLSLHTRKWVCWNIKLRHFVWLSPDKSISTFSTPYHCWLAFAHTSFTGQRSISKLQQRTPIKWMDADLKVCHCRIFISGIRSMSKPIRWPSHP